MPAHPVASDYREAALPQAQGAALGPVKAQVNAKVSLFRLQSPWLVVSPAALPRQVRGRRTSQANLRSQEDGRIRQWVREQTGIEFRQYLLCCFLSNLRACRHCDCPAATGQDDPGRRRPRSVMSTKPLLRIEGIWLVVERHGSPSLFFRGSRYPHLILGFGILRPKAVVRHSKTPSLRTIATLETTANPLTADTSRFDSRPAGGHRFSSPLRQ